MQCRVNFVAEFSACSTRVAMQIQIFCSVTMGIIRMLIFSFIRRFPAHAPVSEISIIKAGQFVMESYKMIPCAATWAFLKAKM